MKPQTTTHGCGDAPGRPLHSEAPDPVVGLPIERAAGLLPANLLSGDELVLLILKPSPFYVVLSCLGTLGLLAMLTASAVWLQRRGEAEWFNEQSLVYLSVFLSLVRVGWQLLEWTSRTYILTDRRVIRIMGVLRPQMYQAALSQLREPQILYSVRERVLGLGTVAFTSRDSQNPEAYWVMVARPEDVKRQVVEAIGRYGKK